MVLFQIQTCMHSFHFFSFYYGMIKIRYNLHLIAKVMGLMKMAISLLTRAFSFIFSSSDERVRVIILHLGEHSSQASPWLYRPFEFPTGGSPDYLHTVQDNRLFTRPLDLDGWTNSCCDILLWNGSVYFQIPMWNLMSVRGFRWCAVKPTWTGIEIMWADTHSHTHMYGTYRHTLWVLIYWHTPWRKESVRMPQATNYFPE